MEGQEKKVWGTSPEALELGFVRQSLIDLMGRAKTFASEHNIAYEIDDRRNEEYFRIFPAHGDFGPLRSHVESMIPHLQDLFLTHAKNYTLDIHEYNNGLHIEAVKK